MDFRIVTATSASNPIANDLYLDDSGQLVWLGGDISDGENYARMIAQRAACRLRTVRGEWFLDQREGTPWRERVWRKGVTADMIRRVVRAVLSSTPGIEDVGSVTVDISGRSATIAFEAKSDMRTPVTSDMLDEPIVVEVP